MIPATTRIFGRSAARLRPQVARSRLRSYLALSLVLLLVLTLAVSVAGVLSALALDMAHVAEKLTAATLEAQAAAERFYANPTQESTIYEADDLCVHVVLEPQESAGGTLYRATITVFDNGSTGAGATSSQASMANHEPTGSHAEPAIFALAAARFVSGGGA